MPSDPRPTSPGSLERRWHVPPLPTHLSGAFAGMAVLEEVAGALGLALWQSLRDVMLWASAPPAARARLFAPGAARARAVPDSETREPELREPLEGLLGMVEDAGAATPQKVALACMRISQWAEARGASSTALAFAEAAASAAPGDASMALAAGRLARQKGEFARAESWFLRSIRMGRQSGDWSSYAWSYGGLGRIHFHRGAYPRAHKRFLRSLRTARRFGLHTAEVEALMNLFIIAAESGRLEEAEGRAREAYEVMGAGHPHLPRLAHDLAHFWSTQGYFARALPVVQALLPYWEGTRERLFVMADLCRAAGGAGDRALFEEGWSAVWDGIDTLGGQDSGSQSLLDVAYGAASLGENARAETAARRALEIATARNEGAVRLETEALLDSLCSTEARARGAKEGDEEAEPVEGDFLAAEIVEDLVAHAPG